MELVKGICVDLTHKYELKLKIKSTKGSKHNRFRSSIQTKNKKQNKPRKVLLGFDDKYGNTRLDKTYRFRK